MSTTWSYAHPWLHRKLGNSSLFWVATQPAEKLEILWPWEKRGELILGEGEPASSAQWWQGYFRLSSLWYGPSLVWHSGSILIPFLEMNFSPMVMNCVKGLLTEVLPCHSQELHHSLYLQPQGETDSWYSCPELSSTCPNSDQVSNLSLPVQKISFQLWSVRGVFLSLATYDSSQITPVPGSSSRSLQRLGRSGSNPEGGQCTFSYCIRESESKIPTKLNDSRRDLYCHR